MKTLLLTALVLLATACTHEISHTESNKANFLGGRTKEETTVTQNPDGTINTEHSKQTIK